MYNLLVAGSDGYWDEGVSTVRRDRFCMGTSPEIARQFEVFDEGALARLRTFPTLFAPEHGIGAVRLGWLREIVVRSSHLRIRFDLASDVSFTWSVLEPLSNKLDIERNGLGSTHWAIKDEDLLRILTEARLLPKHLAVAGTPSRRLAIASDWVEIGRGGFGTVYKAPDARLGVTFAVKVFDPFPGTDADEARKRFMREASLLFKLRHENIVRIHDVIDGDDGRPSIKMEYFDGLNLQKLREEVGIDPTRVARVVGQLALALVHAHDRGILHRDIKPTNILVSKSMDEVRLIDFGLGLLIEEAVERSRLTRSNSLGDLYAAQELRDDARTTDPTIDVYSLAAVWFWMLAGRAPSGSSVREDIARFELPPHHARLLTDCLARSPQRPSAAELVQRLDAVDPTPPAPASSVSPTAVSVAIAGPRFELFANHASDTFSLRSRAAERLPETGQNERLIIVSPFGAPHDGFGLTIGEIARLAERCRITGPGDLLSFPPPPLRAASPRRFETGILWHVPGEKLALAMGTDGSVAIRCGLRNDRDGEGARRARGEHGLYSTVEWTLCMVAAACTIEQQLRGIRGRRWWFRYELLQATASSLVRDRPHVITERFEPLTREWVQSSLPDETRMALAGTFDSSLDRDDLSSGLDTISVRIAEFYGAEELVASLGVGREVVRAYGSALPVP